MASVKLYGSGSTSANAVASVVIPSKGRLRGALVTMWMTSQTSGVTTNCEVSRASAREIGVNGAQQCVLEVSMANNFVTSGMAMAAVNQFFPLDVEVVQGQIIYLHAVVSGIGVYNFTCNLIYG